MISMRRARGERRHQCGAGVGCDHPCLLAGPGGEPFYRARFARGRGRAWAPARFARL